MPDHSYHCVNCGALLTPEDVVYDISGIAFFGALPGDYSQFPIYASKEKMETLFSWSEGKGTSSISLREWIGMLYEQRADKLDPGTRKEDADTAYETFHTLLNRQKEQEQYAFSSVEVAIVPGLPDNLSRILTGNCGEDEVCRCTIQFDAQYGYSIVDYAGRSNKTSFSDHRCCKQCHSMLLERAFQCEQTLVGFIGFQQVGKTCLIAALCKYLDYAAPGSQLLLRDCEERAFKREMKKYQNGFSLKQTASDGHTKINPTIYLEDGERPARMLTFVDIAGEAFNNDEGKFDPSLMENNFRAIADCSLYIFCTSLAAFEAADFGSMQKSLGNFINHLSRTGERSAPSPIMVAVMQMDGPTNCVENRKDVPYLEEYLYSREYNQIYNIRESDQLKAAIPGEWERKIIDKRLQSFLSSVNAMLYYTSVTCSAYGRQPVDQIFIQHDTDSIQRSIQTAIRMKQPWQIVFSGSAEHDILYRKYQEAFGMYPEIIEIIRQNENQGSTGQPEQTEINDRISDQAIESSSLRFKPNPRNIGLIFDWIMRMIGEREIPSRSRDKAPLPPMDCRHLSSRDYHTNEMEVQVIARMFVNPHKYDIRLYRIAQSPGLLAGFQKRHYLAEVSKVKSNGEPLHI